MFLAGDFNMPPPNKGNINSLSTQNTNVIKSSQVIGQKTAAAPINYITDNIHLSGAAAVMPPTNKDKLACFVNYHLVQEATGVLLVDDVLQKYKDFCSVNNNSRQYI